MTKTKSDIFSFPLILISLVVFSCSEPEKKIEDPTKPQKKVIPEPNEEYSNWSVYRGDNKANQYSELAQIHAANVHRLEPAWQYRTGDASKRSSMQCNPIVIDGLLYISTSTLMAVALDAATGEEVWVFESSKYNEDQKLFRGRSRGVTYWQSEDGSDRRIFHFVKDRVYALNAKTGELITSFGQDGHIDLRQNLDMNPDKASVEVTSPGAVYKNTLIVGSRVPEGYNSTPGHIRAYNTKTGAFEWIFNTIPKEGEYGFDTWQFEEGETYGGANVWSGFTIDKERGWVFCSTGSPAFDFFGGNRKGQNLFGNCVLAINAKTGERIWHYQTVHHDIWDYDNPPSPILVSLGRRGNRKDAVVQMTKMGLTYVLDRETGEPIFPIEELPTPPSTIDGEEAWPTQPMPLKPPPLNPLSLTEANLTNISPEANAYAKKKFAEYVSGPIYTAASERGTLTTPGFFGGVEWHGGSYDPYLNLLYVNSNNATSIAKLTKIYESTGDDDTNSLNLGRLTFIKNCALCHGIDLKGIPPTYPGLLNISKTKEEIVEVIKTGKNIMPSFPQFNDEELSALASFISNNGVYEPDSLSQGKVKYVMAGYNLFRDNQGFPAIAPPWGTLTAIDLTTGDFAWRIPLGEYPKLVEQGIRNTGTLTFGGAVATSGGLIFIASTADEKIRAFEKSRGKLLWEFQLPAGGYATPSVYMKNGRQYVTIVAGGGGKNGTPSGDYVMSFALSEDYINSRKAGKTENVKMDSEGWISLFDGKTLDGWVHLNQFHQYAVEDGAIVGRTTPNSLNSFLCSTQEFDDFEFECDVMVDNITNQGVQFRSSVRPVSEKDRHDQRAGRVWGPQLEIRRNMGPKKITTGVLYGEGLGTGWISTQEKKEDSHDYFISEGWNRIRIVADGPRMQTFVNGHKIEDVIDEQVYKTHPKGFIGLQVHGIEGDRQYKMGWKNIKIRPL